MSLNDADIIANVGIDLVDDSAPPLAVMEDDNVNAFPIPRESTDTVSVQNSHSSGDDEATITSETVKGDKEKPSDYMWVLDDFRKFKISFLVSQPSVGVFWSN